MPGPRMVGGFRPEIGFAEIIIMVLTDGTYGRTETFPRAAIWVFDENVESSGVLKEIICLLQSL